MGTHGDDPLERWRHYERRYADCVAGFLSADTPTVVDKDAMVELASLRAEADRWRDRYFKRLEGIRD